MTQLGGRQWAQVWTAVSSALASEQHLATEAIVAYVDGELSLSAHARATQHLVECTLCTAEVAAQRQARTAVRSASAPAMPPTLLAALHAIPHSVELPPAPEELAVGEDGELVVAQRPVPRREGVPLGLSAPLGSGASTPLGAGARLGSMAPLGRTSRRVRAGAGVVVSGLVLGALALAAPADPTLPGVPRSGAGGSSSPVVEVPARFESTPRQQRPAVVGLVLR